MTTSQADIAAAAIFAPCESLAGEVLAAWSDRPAGSDASHDISHLARVWRLAKHIAADETEADLDILAAATLLHDCVSLEKNDPRRAMSSRLSADVARDLLTTLGWPGDRVERVTHAIEAHSFSAGITPVTVEAAILRDADRLDALGALGIARTFYVAGRLGAQLYDFGDPFADFRALDDRIFALDHFPAKLLRLRDGLLTPRGQAIGEARTTVLLGFLDALRAEIAPEVGQAYSSDAGPA